MSLAITEMYRKADQKLLCSCLTRKDVRKFTEKQVQRTQPWLPEEKAAAAVEALMRDGYEEYQKSLQKHKLDQIKRTLRNLLKRCGCKNEVWDGSYACKCEVTCRGTQLSFFGLVAINRSFCLKLKNLNRQRYGRLEIEAPAVCKTNNLDAPGSISRGTAAPLRVVVPQDHAQEAEDLKQDEECPCTVGLKKQTINVEELLKEFEIIETIETEVLPDLQGTCRKEHERFLNKVKNVLRCPRCAQNPTKRQCHATVVKQKSEDTNKCRRKLLADEIGVDALRAQINERKLSSLENSGEVLKVKQPVSRKLFTDEEGVDALQAQLDFLQLGAQSFSKFLMAFADRKQKGDAVVMLEEIKTKHLRKLKEELRTF